MLGLVDSASLTASGRSAKRAFVSRGTVVMATSFTCALTEYIPYVGGQISILSRPGVQKQRMMLSMASSEPTPTKRLAG